MKSLRIGTCLGILFYSTYSHAWGKLGHELIAELAAEVASEVTGVGFWNANVDNMGYLSNVPDNMWKRGDSAAQEKPTHYFEPDGFLQDMKDFQKFPLEYDKAVSQYEEDVIQKHGTAIWRIEQFYKMSVAAFAKNQHLAGLRHAGALTHYLGDLSQPLHVTINYDGQLTDQDGIHAFFESTNLNKRDIAAVKKQVMVLTRQIMASAEFKNDMSKGVIHVAAALVVDSYNGIADILDVDSELGRGKEGAAEQYTLAKERLAKGVAYLAGVLIKITNAAKLNAEMSLKVDKVPWVEPRYSSKLKAENFSFFKGTSRSSIVDCN